MAKKNKYEVVPYNAGGFFVHGGSLGDTHFSKECDAKTVCDALNMVERLKLKSVQRKLDEVFETVRILSEALAEGTEQKF